MKNTASVTHFKPLDRRDVQKLFDVLEEDMLSGRTFPSGKFSYLEAVTEEIASAAEDRCHAFKAALEVLRRIDRPESS